MESERNGPHIMPCKNRGLHPSALLLSLSCLLFVCCGLRMGCMIFVCVFVCLGKEDVPPSIGEIEKRAQLNDRQHVCMCICVNVCG